MNAGCLKYETEDEDLTFFSLRFFFSFLFSKFLENIEHFKVDDTLVPINLTPLNYIHLMHLLNLNIL